MIGEVFRWCVTVLATAVAVVGVVYAMYLFFRWSDDLDRKHYDRVEREANAACGANRPVDIESQDDGWWFIVTCRDEAGKLYAVVVR